jgi:hypothetical protein
MFSAEDRSEFGGRDFSANLFAPPAVFALVQGAVWPEKATFATKGCHNRATARYK